MMGEMFAKHVLEQVIALNAMLQVYVSHVMEKANYPMVTLMK